MNSVYLNGKTLPIEEACVSVLDRGFLLGDGVYEVIPAYAGKLFRLDQHLERLNNSLGAIGIINPHTHGEWKTILQKLVTEHGTDDYSVYLQVTRGVAAKRDHVFPEEVIPTVFVMCNPIPPVDDTILQYGVTAITLDDIRWKRCDIKAITLLANVILKQEAHDADAAEAILIKDGMALEGAASNLFIVMKGKIITPPKSNQLLPGVTRDLVLELAEVNGIPFKERPVMKQELLNAQEIWLTSSTREILPVTKLDNERVNDGKPGAFWINMIDLYRQYKQQLKEMA
ncbi:MAG TPA: D-amino acid aminotransferase [Gammaproteobacteria bacterium]|nr:D-amino acid aminotransferase [Gammaproteobacteria bacterium]